MIEKLNKSYTLFQWVLIGLMIVSIIFSNREVLLLSLMGFLIGFIEPKYKEEIEMKNKTKTLKK